VIEGPVGGSSTDEWASYTGTRAGSDLIVSIGDYDDTDTGFKIQVDTLNEEFKIGDFSGNYVILNSSGLTSSRSFTFPDSSGTLALTSDLSSLSADQEITDFNATIDQVGVMVDVDSATDVVVTVRAFSIEPIPVGSVLTYRQAGVGKISNTYLGAAGSSATTYRVGDVLTLWQKTQDNWVVINPPHAIDSQTAGEPTGSDQVLNVVSLTQAEYDAAVGSHNADTLYVITS
jgi:hypothetical protein